MTIELIILQIISVIVNTYLSFTENKKNIYVVTFLFNFLQMLMYLFKDDMTTVLSYVIIVVRSFVYIYKDKFKTKHIVPWTFVAIQLVVGFMTMENYLQLISIITPCIVILYLWYCKTTQGLRVGNIVNNTAWGVYNALTGLYIIIITRVIAVITNSMGLWKNRNKKE